MDLKFNKHHLQSIPLVLLFIGPLLYLYLVYKSGGNTSRPLTGIYFATLGVSSIAIGIHLIQKKKTFFRLNFIDALLIVYWGYIFVNHLFLTMGNSVSINKLLYAPFLVILPYFGVRLQFCQKFIRSFFQVLTVLIIALLFVAYAELFFNQELVNLRIRFSMFYFDGAANPSNPILFGMVFAILNIYCICQWFKNKKHPLLLCIIVIASTYLIVRSGSRGVIVSYHAAIFFYVFVLKRKFLQGSILLGFLVVLLLALISISPNNLRGFYKFSVSPDSLVSEKSSYNMRLELYKESFDDLEISSMLFGKGIGTSAGGTGYAHNIIIENFAEFGLVGLILFLCFIFACLARWYIFWTKTKSDLFYAELIIVYFIFFGIEAMFSGQITQQTQLFITLAFINSISQNNKPQSKRDSLD